MSSTVRHRSCPALAIFTAALLSGCAGAYSSNRAGELIAALKSVKPRTRMRPPLVPAASLVPFGETARLYTEYPRGKRDTVCASAVLPGLSHISSDA